MAGTLLSLLAVLGAGLLIGRALLVLLRRPVWNGLEAAIGLAAIFAACGLLARFPGRSAAATLGLGAMLVSACLILIWDRGRRPATGGRARLAELAPWLTTAAVVTAALCLPFLLNGRWGLIGIGVNNDMGLHLAWSEWLRSGLGPVPEPGYPLGPHALVSALDRLPGIGAQEAFTGLLLAISVITAITALAVVSGRSLLGRDPAASPSGEAEPVTFRLTGWRAVLAAALVALCYLAVAYFAQAAFKELAQALFVLAFTAGLPWLSAGLNRWQALVLATVVAAGVVFSYSFAGLAWLVGVAGLWAITRPGFWGALRPRNLPGTVFSLFTLALLGVIAVAVVMLGFTNSYGFGGAFSEVAGSNTYGPVSPLEALGIWPEENYRLDSTGWPGPAIPIGAFTAAVLVLCGVVLLRNRMRLLPVAVLACTIVYLASFPVSGDYSRAKALIIMAPLVTLMILPVLLAGPALAFGRRDRQGVARPTSPGSPGRAAWLALAAVFVVGSVASSFLVLRDTRVAPSGHLAQLQQFLPWIEDRQVLYAGQDRYAAQALRGADPAVPLVEFPDHRITESETKPFDTGSAYSPIDFDSFQAATLDRFPFVITGAAAWNSQAPPNFEEVSRTDSFVLWKRNGETPEGRRTLIEGTQAAAPVNCRSPEMSIFASGEGRASVLPTPALARRDGWEPGRDLRPGESSSQTLNLAEGTWRLSLQYFSSVPLTITAADTELEVIPTLDGQRPSTISLANDGQFWPAGRIEVGEAGPVTFTIQAADRNLLQSLLGYSPITYLGNLVALPDSSNRLVPLSQTCGKWVDWYRSDSGS